MDIPTIVKIINVLGLILDGVGAYIMIYYTPEITHDPATLSSDGISVISRAGDWELFGKAREDKQRRFNKIGLRLLLLGFGLQLIAAVLG